MGLRALPPHLGSMKVDDFVQASDLRLAANATKAVYVDASYLIDFKSALSIRFILQRHFFRQKYFMETSMHILPDLHYKFTDL